MEVTSCLFYLQGTEGTTLPDEIGELNGAEMAERENGDYRPDLSDHPVDYIA